MENNMLFAIDLNSEEIIVSNSPKGSNKINLIERISRKKNNILYDSVLTLTSITKDTNFDVKIFKAMDKVCHMIYNRHIEKNSNK